jgi:TIR domain
LAASHIFICFSSKDEAIARGVVAFLESAGLKCWISLRDVLPGENYQESIVRAIEAAQGIVFLFSESSNLSGEIRKELSIGGSINVPVFPLRLSPVAPSTALRAGDPAIHRHFPGSRGRARKARCDHQTRD